jgi:hypothetical protein
MRRSPRNVRVRSGQFDFVKLNAKEFDWRDATTRLSGIDVSLIAFLRSTIPASEAVENISGRRIRFCTSTEIASCLHLRSVESCSRVAGDRPDSQNVQHHRQGDEKPWDKHERERADHPVGNFRVDQVQWTRSCQYRASHHVDQRKQPQHIPNERELHSRSPSRGQPGDKRR